MSPPVKGRGLVQPAPPCDPPYRGISVLHFSCKCCVYSCCPHVLQRVSPCRHIPRGAPQFMVQGYLTYTKIHPLGPYRRPMSRVLGGS